MSRNPKPQPTKPFTSVASKMTLDHYTAVEEASAAELRGDWSTAYEQHRSVPMFRESQHGGWLRLLADLGEDAPDWLVTRFVTYMAHRLEQYGQPRRSGRVLQHLVPQIYPHGIHLAQIGCDHHEQVGAFIFGRDWVVRQANVYELGGLEDLLGNREAAGVLAKAPLVEDWLDAPMGGYLVIDVDAGVLRVADAARGEVLELLDLGLTTQRELGSYVLGRVVPTSVEPGLLFDWQPVPVDARTARDVARMPDRWLSIVTERTSSKALPDGFSHLPDASLSADLPRWSWGALIGDPIDDLRKHPATSAPKALTAALEMAGDAASLKAKRHLISELLLDEALDQRLLATFAAPRYREAWTTLAGELPAHAARRCHEVLWLTDAADEGLAG